MPPPPMRVTSTSRMWCVFPALARHRDPCLVILCSWHATLCRSPLIPFVTLPSCSLFGRPCRQYLFRSNAITSPVPVSYPSISNRFFLHFSLFLFVSFNVQYPHPTLLPPLPNQLHALRYPLPLRPLSWFSGYPHFFTPIDAAGDTDPVMLVILVMLVCW